MQKPTQCECGAPLLQSQRPGTLARQRCTTCAARRKKELDRRWYLAHRRERLAALKAKYAANPEPARARQRAYCVTDRGREVSRVAGKKYRRTPKGQAVHRWANWRHMFGGPVPSDVRRLIEAAREMRAAFGLKVWR